MKYKFLATGYCLLFTIFISILSQTSVLAATCTRFVVNTANSGTGSLRQAIVDSNAASDLDTICFSIATDHQQIIPTSPLPPVTQPAIIDGTHQPGFNTTTNAPLIEISGNSAGSSAIGIRITGNGAGSTIKGLVINRFSSNGIFLDSSNNVVTGNYIGTSSDGNSAAANGGDGIGIFSGINIAPAKNNRIGGTVPADRNVISGNAQNGLVVNNQNGGDTSNNTITGNYIGTNAAGTQAISNGADGILVNNPDNSGAATGIIIGGAVGVSVGGGCTGACNLVSGNGYNGVGLWRTAVTNASVLGNYIGTDVNGLTAIPNANIGVELNESANNTVGGATPQERNILSGNLGAGVFLTGDGAHGNTVSGNYIGTDKNGISAIPNTKMGVGIGYSPGIQPAHDNNIGGTTNVSVGGPCTGSCNLISGNLQNGLLITGPGGNHISGNYIGTDVSGTQNIRNHFDGLGIVDSPVNLIGGAIAAAGNVISANSDNGVIIVGASSNGNRIENNHIGTGSNGNSLGNAGSGVLLVDGINTAISANSINYNVKLGIDLGYNGITQNHIPAINSGVNESVNFPNIYAAKNTGTTTRIGGQLNTLPNTSYKLDFFTSPNCNGGVPNNYGQGQQYIGSTQVSTDRFGNSAFSFTPAVQTPGGLYVTSTATKMVGSLPAETSEFSLCRLVNVAKPALTNGANWFLKNDLTSGPGDAVFGYGFPASLLMCAWDVNQPGVKLPVVVAGNNWYMRASYTTGTADLQFQYGFPGGKPVCGDWDGDGVDTPGFVSNDSTWYLRNSNSTGNADITFQYGPANTKPVVGDWDGNGTDTIGTVDTGNNWSLRNSNSSGPADSAFNYGFTPSYPVVGDWNGDGVDTVGSVSAGGTWALRNSNTAGSANVNFQYGLPSLVPVIW